MLAESCKRCASVRMPAEGSTAITSKTRLANHDVSRPEPAPTSRAGAGLLCNIHLNV
jgi:hypothetical protein